MVGVHVSARLTTRTGLPGRWSRPGRARGGHAEPIRPKYEEGPQPLNSCGWGPFTFGAGDENRTRVASLEDRSEARSLVAFTLGVTVSECPGLTAVDRR